MKNYIAITLTNILFLIGFISCDKNTLPVPYEIVGSNQAKVKLNYESPYALNPGIHLKIDEQRISSVITYAYPFPGGGLNTGGGSQPDYLALTPGTHTISIAIPYYLTNNDSLQLFSGSVSIPDGNYYTVHICDTAQNTQLVVVQNDVNSPDSGFSKYKFVNLIPNSPPLDLYFGGLLVANDIPYKGTSEMFTVSFPTVSSWEIRLGTDAPTATALASYKNTSPNQRVLTVFARGYLGVTDVRKPNVSLMYDR